VASDSKELSETDVEAIDAHASMLMKQGIRLMNDARLDADAMALEFFDRALELRSRLPYQSVPVLRYGLAACWLNRADVLARSDDAERITAALHSYGEAIHLASSLPLADDPRFPRRLAIAHQNRGLALRHGGEPGLVESITAFTRALEVLERDECSAISDRLYLLATVLVNLANAQVSVGTRSADALAREAARRAISLVADGEENDAASADVGLKARHALCRALARSLEAPVEADAMTPEDVHEATDAVDDGLSLARRWELRGVESFRELADDLFRFGALVYERYQPQFLSEFIAEHTSHQSSVISRQSSVVSRQSSVVSRQSSVVSRQS
jgi:hypothetical protein